jgi:hypothetical protein
VYLGLDIFGCVMWADSGGNESALMGILALWPREQN